MVGLLESYLAMVDSKHDRGDETETTPVDHFRKKLSASGSGAGVSLHFDADFATTYHLDPDTVVDVQVVDENGDVALKIGNIPAGFSYEDLTAFADRQGWKPIDDFADEEPDEWHLTYRNSNENVRIEIDSESQINGRIVNNVVIEGDPVTVTKDMELYRRLCAAASRYTNLCVQVNDSKGLWQNLRRSSNHDSDDVPSEETLNQLCTAAEKVTAQLVCQRTSLKTTLSEIEVIVSEIEMASNGLDDHQQQQNSRYSPKGAN